MRHREHTRLPVKALAKSDCKSQLGNAHSYTCYCTVLYCVPHVGPLQSAVETKVVEEEREEERVGNKDSQRLTGTERRRGQGNSSPQHS